MVSMDRTGYGPIRGIIRTTKVASSKKTRLPFVANLHEDGPQILQEADTSLRVKGRKSHIKMQAEVRA
jgi:hypothetical protein